MNHTSDDQNTPEDLVYRLRKRAEIRRQIPSRKSVQEGQPDRIADLLDEAATEIERLRKGHSVFDDDDTFDDMDDAVTLHNRGDRNDA